MTRWDVCNAHLAKRSPSCFLEIGTGVGRGARLVSADVLVGVDPAPRGPMNAYTEFYMTTSDQFFAVNERIFDVVLVDGLHHANQAWRDIGNALGCLAKDGLIVVHDCNPQDDVSQAVPRPSGQFRWNGDVWKAIVRLRVLRSDLRVMTMDADEGIGLITKAANTQSTIADPGELTWAGLVEHRTEWLGLISC